jgi:hypothetical protein
MLANKMLADNVIGEWPILSRQAINSLTIRLLEHGNSASAKIFERAVIEGWRAGPI